eukprot:15445704-Alexandrium_andersonii.AAC.1
MAKLVQAPTPSWTRLPSKPRQRAEESSPRPGIRLKLETPSRRALFLFFQGRDERAHHSRCDRSTPNRALCAASHPHEE